MNIKTHLSLGRVSNLPTMWTNVLAAGAVADADASLSGWIPFVIAGICLIDGLFIAWVCGLPGALTSIAAFALTPVLQRWIAGT